LRCGAAAVAEERAVEQMGRSRWRVQMVVAFSMKPRRGKGAVGARGRGGVKRWASVGTRVGAAATRHAWRPCWGN
jgi:hypothetical protein